MHQAKYYKLCELVWKMPGREVLSVITILVDYSSLRSAMPRTEPSELEPSRKMKPIYILLTRDTNTNTHRLEYTELE